MMSSGTTNKNKSLPLVVSSNNRRCTGARLMAAEVVENRLPQSILGDGLVSADSLHFRVERIQIH